MRVKKKLHSNKPLRRWKKLLRHPSCLVNTAATLLYYANVMEPAEMSSTEQNPEINHQSKKTSSSSHHLETQLVEGKAKTGF